jgi:predicted transcriptional regulator
MAKVLKYRDVESFSKDMLGLDDYDSWLISTKNQIIAAIVRERKRKRVSQKELAETLGTTQSVISRIESGTTRNITIDYLMKVATGLGISSKIILKKTA